MSPEYIRPWAVPVVCTVVPCQSASVNACQRQNAYFTRGLATHKSTHSRLENDATLAHAASAGRLQAAVCAAHAHVHRSGAEHMRAAAGQVPQVHTTGHTQLRRRLRCVQCTSGYFRGQRLIGCLALPSVRAAADITAWRNLGVLQAADGTVQ